MELHIPSLLWWIFLGALPALYTAFLIHRSQSEKLRMREARLKKESPDIKYDYNRFNTKAERSTTIEINQDQFIIKTDIQNVQIANVMLYLRISSEIEEVGTVRFDLICLPFLRELISAEHYTQSDIKGMIIFFNRPPYTSVLLEYLLKKHEVSLTASSDFSNVYLPFDAVITDPAENLIHIKGLFPDGKNWHAQVNIKDYQISLEAPISSITDPSNFAEAEWEVEE